MSSNELVRRTPQQELIADLRDERFKQQVAIALPGNVTPERFVRIAVTAIQANPDIASADYDSVIRSFIQSAQLGLLPDGREAAIVLFGKKATLMPMISGYRKIAAEYGWALRTRVVYEADEFEYAEGVETILVHQPARPGVQRGKMIAAYAVGAHKDGRREIEVMYAEDIERVRKVARSQNVWNDWTDRMYEKTVGRRLFAKLPLDEADKERVERVLSADTDPVTAIYGRDRVAEAPALPPASATPRSDHDASDSESGGGQQAGDAASKGDDASIQASSTAASPAPDPDAQADAGDAGDGGFNQPETVPQDALVVKAQAASLVVIPIGQYKGKTLADVSALGDKGSSWLKYSLTNFDDGTGTTPSSEPKYGPGEFVTALWDYSKVYAPDIATEVQAAREAAA